MFGVIKREQNVEENFLCRLMLLLVTRSDLDLSFKGHWLSYAFNI